MTGSDHIYRISGDVTAPDGSTYSPDYWGDFYSACRVRDAIVNGCVRRGETFAISTDRYQAAGGSFVARIGLLIWEPTKGKVENNVS